MENPGAIGTLNLVNARVDNQPVQQAALDFRYADSRLNFESAIQLTETQPLEIAGSIPVTLPFTSAQPESNQIRLQAQIANEGLALLNLFADDVRVSRPPLLSFTAEGDLVLNGTFANPRPEGTIRLTGGQVNLFTTQFRLERGEEQTARFVPSLGFDPILDVQLFALVPEATGNRLPQSQFSSEIIDNPFSENLTTSIGTLRTVRVEAQATGLASELSQNLTLTSTPSRSEAEILALIGGNFINTLGQADTALGIANIAGTALSNRLQEPITALGQAIGLSELRIFPTIVTDQAENVSVLGLALEAVVDVTDDVSVSISRVFASDEPFRYNLLYRINDDLRIRASTNFAGESRALIQYETRF